MYGHPKELASHGAEFPCVSASARAYYGRSVQLTDFLDWREQHIHLATSFLVSVGDTLLQVRSGLERERASGARIKDGRKVSLYLMCVDLIRAVLCKHGFLSVQGCGHGVHSTGAGLCSPCASLWGRERHSG